MTKKLRKILFVRPTMGDGGADRVTLTLIREINRNDFVPELLLMRQEGEFIKDIPNDVIVHNCNALSLWHMVLPMKKVLRKKQYDFVYSTCGGAAIPLIIAFIISGCTAKLVVSERNILFPPNKNYWKRKLMLFLKSILYPRADWIATVSKGVGNEVIEMLRIPKEKIKVVNNPVIDSVLLTSKEGEVKHPFFLDNIPVLLSVGRLVPQKDYPTLLKAFKIVVKKNKVRLFILGKGPMLATYKSLASDLGLSSDQVCFAGFDKNPFKYMTKCHAFILSSKHEGMPGVLIQAMACGAACVSTDCPTGPSEIIEHGINGLLSPVGDPKALASNIVKVLDDQQLQKQFRQKAPSSVKRFEVQPALDSYLNFLKL